MWKPHQSSAPDAVNLPTPIRVPEAPRPIEIPARPAPPAQSAGQSTLAAGLVVKGHLHGTDSLYLDGQVEGSIQIPDARVTIGPNGRVVGSAPGGAAACITAREIVVMGKVRGNLFAGDRVEIRANGNVSGDISTVRISIEDGAIFRGGIDIRRETAAQPSPSMETAESRNYAGAAR